MGRIEVIHPCCRPQTSPCLGEVGLDVGMARGGVMAGNVPNPAELLKRDAALYRERVIASHQQQELTRRAECCSNPGIAPVIVINAAEEQAYAH